MEIWIWLVLNELSWTRLRPAWRISLILSGSWTGVRPRTKLLLAPWKNSSFPYQTEACSRMVSSHQPVPWICPVQWLQRKWPQPWSGLASRSTECGWISCSSKRSVRQPAKHSIHNANQFQVLAGVMLSFGGLLYTVVSGGSPGLAASNPGIVRVLAAFVFPVGLVMWVNLHCWVMPFKW